MHLGELLGGHPELVAPEAQRPQARSGLATEDEHGPLGSEVVVLELHLAPPPRQAVLLTLARHHGGRRRHVLVPTVGHRAGLTVGRGLRAAIQPAMTA